MRYALMRVDIFWYDLLDEFNQVCLVAAPVLEADRQTQTGNLDSRLIKRQVRILAHLHILEEGGIR